MNALCPEHGYMVRRKENSGLYFQVPGYNEADYEEEDEDDEMNESDEEEITEEKQENESWEHSSGDKND